VRTPPKLNHISQCEIRFSESRNKLHVVRCVAECTMTLIYSTWLLRNYRMSETETGMLVQFGAKMMPVYFLSQ